MVAPQYKETLFSRLYPGSQHSNPVYIPVIDALDQFLPWDKGQKERTILRTDSGFGSDDNINHALGQQWQVLTKGSGGRRPKAFAKRVQPDTWRPVGVDRWVAPAVDPPTYVDPVQHLVLAWLNQKKETKYATIVCSVLDWSLETVIDNYDDRGACETEIQADKGGLKLCKRRKKSLAAQEALVLLTDLAHNLMAWLPRWMNLPPPLTAFGTTRLVEDILAIPGHLQFDEKGKLLEIQLNELHPHAEHVAIGLKQLFHTFGNP